MREQDGETIVQDDRESVGQMGTCSRLYRAMRNRPMTRHTTAGRTLTRQLHEQMEHFEASEMTGKLRMLARRLDTLLHKRAR
ncbi:hypothetical protein SAMN05443573_103284 [Celeribacter indicus]|uniref:Uncharacterized protein n=1 Tax=Celeribacter indicus TaxID=1208324 RepID=A0A0B5E1B5_9RHOB|nr:hypothetical protein P73_4359 [Celeribacter indicus]SDW45238.1 hypothetical protein SAMN05443573_103284 [Celeribacter indicus]